MLLKIPGPIIISDLVTFYFMRATPDLLQVA